MQQIETGEQLRFNDYSTYLRKTFGCRVQKISINTGYSCPNRDGTKAYHGCTYCNITALQPEYARHTQSVTAQIEKGIAFFAKRKNTKTFLAYFQSYSNTYHSLEKLKHDYEEALGYPGVAGIIIGTRPDCVSAELVEYLTTLTAKHYVAVEIGIESTFDATLQHVNRCHSYSDVIKSFQLLKDKGIKLGGHLILGFPWESRDTMLEHAAKISSLPLDFIKLHHLQILRHTRLAKEYEEHQYKLMDIREYVKLAADFVERCSPKLIFQRFLAEAPPSLLVAPDYNGVRNYSFTQMVNSELIARKSYQSRKYQSIQM